eukprot:gene1913-1158_t
MLCFLLFSNITDFSVHFSGIRCSSYFLKIRTKFGFDKNQKKIKRKLSSYLNLFALLTLSSIFSIIIRALRPVRKKNDWKLSKNKQLSALIHRLYLSVKNNNILIILLEREKNMRTEEQVEQPLSSLTSNIFSINSNCVNFTLVLLIIRTNNYFGNVTNLFIVPLSIYVFFISNVSKK